MLKVQTILILSLVGLQLACSPARLSGTAGSEAVQTKSNGIPSDPSPRSDGGGTAPAPGAEAPAAEPVTKSPETTRPAPVQRPPMVAETPPPKVQESNQQIPQTESMQTPEPAPAAEEKVASTQVLDSCFAPQEPCDQKIIAFLRSAQRTLDIAIFSITHEGIAQAIEEAQQRGVKVRVIVDREQSTISTSQVDELQKAGIPVRIGRTHGYMHNKFSIVDGVYLETGSYNYTRAATAKNDENQLYLKDPKVIVRYQKFFETLWARGLEN